MSLAIVNNSPSSHCGVAVSPRAPSPTLAGQEASSACISRFGERPFRLRKGMPLTQSATAFLNDLSGRACASPSAHLEKLRPTAQQASPPYVQGPFHSGETTASHLDRGNSALGLSARIPRTGHFARLAPASTQGRARAWSASPRTNEEARGRNPGPQTMYWQPAADF
jgi:hypothetical protein